MAKLILDISTYLDGYVAGPNQTLDEPLGRGGDELRTWDRSFVSSSSRESSIPRR